MTSAAVELESSETDQGPVENQKSGPSYDDINTPVIVMVGVISTIITLCTIFFVQGLSYQWQNSYIRDRSTDFVNQPVRLIVEGQKALLDGKQDGIKSIRETEAEVIKQFGKSSSN